MLEDDLERVRAMAGRMWLAITTDQAREVQAVLSALDRSRILADPILLNAAMMSRHLSARPGSEEDESDLVASSVSMSRYCARAVETSDCLDDLMGYGRILIVGRRAAGDLEEADAIGARLEERVSHLLNGPGAGGPVEWPRPGQLPFQRAVTRTLLGDFAGAMPLYRRAWTDRGAPPYQHFAGANSAANAAMLAALEGHHELAETWLGRLEGYGDRGFGGILLRAELDCLVALGQGNSVIRLARETRTPRALLPMARVQRLSGDDRGALRLAHEAAARGDVPVRDLRELRLVSAVALLRLDRIDGAKAAFDSLCRTAGRYDAAMIARAPAAEYARLCELCGREPPAPGALQRAPAPMDVVRLTRAEQLVLSRLAAGGTLQDVAEASFTSVNTVKTHVRSIYRKLGVNRRRDAVHRAKELGLLG